MFSLWALVISPSVRVLGSTLFTPPAVPSPDPAAVLTFLLSGAACFVSVRYPMSDMAAPSLRLRRRGGFLIRDCSPLTVDPDAFYSPIFGFGPSILPMALDIPANMVPFLPVTRGAAHALLWSPRLSFMCIPRLSWMQPRAVVSSVAPLAVPATAFRQRWLPLLNRVVLVVDILEAFAVAEDAGTRLSVREYVLFTSVFSQLAPKVCIPRGINPFAPSIFAPSVGLQRLVFVVPERRYPKARQQQHDAPVPSGGKGRQLGWVIRTARWVEGGG